MERLVDFVGHGHKYSKHLVNLIGMAFVVEEEFLTHSPD